VSDCILERFAYAGLVNRKRIGTDATTLETNAALPTIALPRHRGEYHECPAKLAEASGIKTQTRTAKARLDRKRKRTDAKRDRQNPHGPDAKIRKMKDRRTHVAHKEEHAVDLKTGVILAATPQAANNGDTTTIDDTLAATVEQLVDLQRTTPKSNRTGAFASTQV
jgi:hypothetical protein